MPKSPTPFVIPAQAGITGWAGNACGGGVAGYAGAGGGSSHCRGGGRQGPGMSDIDVCLRLRFAEAHTHFFAADGAALTSKS